MTTYHPWRDARGRPHLDIAFVDLPIDVRGCQAGDRVELHRKQSQRERRSTLAHELVHDERRIYPDDPVLAEREEIVVERIAARRLIDLEQLVDVICWSRDAEEIAAELWVDAAMLTAFVQSLTDDERAYIDREMERRQP